MEYQRDSYSYDTGWNFVTNASIKLYSDNIEIPSYFNPKFPFYGTRSAATGNVYTLEVSAPGYETITATTTIPSPVQIIEVKSHLTPSENSGFSKRTFNVRFKDPARESNYYAISAMVVERSLKYNEDLTYYGTVLHSADPAFSDDYHTEIFRSPNGYSDFHSNILFNDKLFNGEEYTFNVWCPEVAPIAPQGNTVRYLVFLKSINEAYYNYRVTYNLQKKAKENPLAQPVQVYNNIKNGFGIFSGYSQSRNVHYVQ